MRIKYLDMEPWAVLDIEDMARIERDDLIKINQQNRQAQKYQFYLNVFDFVHDAGVSGDYFEFGCHKARTFRMALNAAKLQSMDGINFYAFDSFEGLPEFGNNQLSNPLWKKGQLLTSDSDFVKMINENGVYVDRVSLIKGFYENSLSEDLKNSFLARKVKASVITIDCDLYESAIPVFGFIEPFLQEGTVVYIDDYYNSFKGNPHNGVPAAFSEFKKTSSWSFEPFLNVGWWGKSFLVYK